MPLEELWLHRLTEHSSPSHQRRHRHQRAQPEQGQQLPLARLEHPLPVRAETSTDPDWARQVQRALEEAWGPAEAPLVPH